MGAERGPSRESMGWWMKYATEHNITKTTERAMLGPVGRNGFDAGREAAMARTCEWSPTETGYKTACGNQPSQSAHVGPPFCEYCGGRIVVAAQDRG